MVKRMIVAISGALVSHCEVAGMFSAAGVAVGFFGMLSEERLWTVVGDVGRRLRCGRTVTLAKNQC
jgi:hypothetical protein